MLSLAAFPSRPGEPRRAAPALIRASATAGTGVADIVAEREAAGSLPFAGHFYRRLLHALRPAAV